MSSEVEASLTVRFVSAVLVECQAFGAYNAKAVRTEAVQIQNFIDGQFVEPVSGRYLDNIEPATGKPYSQVADSDTRDVDLAVAAAERAFPGWAQTTSA